MTEAQLATYRADETIDSNVISRFDAGTWWDATGPARWLHSYNHVRVPYIRNRICALYDREAADPRCLRGIRILDIGCGGGVLCEPLARLGADVVGADPSTNAISIAREHARREGLSIDYRPQTSEELLAEGERFDVVTSMEVIEHVVQPLLFVSRSADLVSPGGALIVSTINRTVKSYLYAILMAQHVLRLLPSDAHQWRMFVRPEEIAGALQRRNMRVVDVSGVTMNLRKRQLQLSPDTAVNFLMTAASSATR